MVERKQISGSNHWLRLTVNIDFRGHGYGESERRSERRETRVLWD
jgi:hypothetical protein